MFWDFLHPLPQPHQPGPLLQPDQPDPLLPGLSTPHLTHHLTHPELCLTQGGSHGHDEVHHCQPGGPRCEAVEFSRVDLSEIEEWAHFTF